jgi:mono/diheme cytochrome c family protein
MRTSSLVLALISSIGIGALSIGLAADTTNAATFSPDPELVERGRYIALIAGCNDCHTPGYAVNNGNVPETLWLTGDTFGWRGPWGTTYGTNLRLLVDSLSEEQWIEVARTLQRRPPMPWFNLNSMHKNDLRGLYHYMRSLGDPGTAAPSALPPDEEPTTPHARWTEGTRSSTP